jgi:hypothetical protein
VSCTARTSSTDDTQNRTESTGCAGIHAAPFHDPFHAPGQVTGRTGVRSDDLAGTVAQPRAAGDLIAAWSRHLPGAAAVSAGRSQPFRRNDHHGVAWVPQLDPLLILRIWPVSCGNRPYSGTHRVYLGARVPAGQRGRQSVRRPAVYHRQTVACRYILSLDWRRAVTLSASHVCAERGRLTERLPPPGGQPCRRSLLT